MKIFYAFLMPLLTVIMVSSGAHSLNYQTRIINNLGICLAAPVIFGDLIVARSCSQKHVNFINSQTYELLHLVDMRFEPNIQPIILGTTTFTFIELEDEITFCKI